MPTSSDGEMKPHEASNHLSQLVREMVHFLKLHEHTKPPTGQVYNHRFCNQVFLSLLENGMDLSRQRTVKVLVELLSQFISPHTGRIYGRHITGLCGRKQKEVSKAIKKAHSMGFMSVTHKHPQFMKDPNICGIKHLD